MKVKVCGTTDIQNIEQLLTVAIDYIGFIFHKGSPRYVGERSPLPAWIDQNQASFGQIRRVGVFVNSEIEEVLNKVHDYQLDFVQLHGVERPEYCRELNTFWAISSMRRAKLIKAFPVDENTDLGLTEAYREHCACFLFDTRGSMPGGTGQAFDWSLLDQYQGSTPFLLAGGIGPGSVTALEAITHPFFLGVDINSRFETEPGIKDVELVRTFVKQIKQSA